MGRLHGGICEGARLIMTDEKTRLGELREEIDALDQQIMELISARAKCAQEVAHVKMAANPGEDVFFYRPEREAQVLRRKKNTKEKDKKNEKEEKKRYDEKRKKKENQKIS